jgi:hypothetical protein
MPSLLATEASGQLVYPNSIACHHLECKLFEMRARVADLPQLMVPKFMEIEGIIRERKSPHLGQLSWRFVPYPSDPTVEASPIDGEGVVSVMK